jgi:hypothetical protein
MFRLVAVFANHSVSNTRFAGATDAGVGLRSVGEDEGMVNHGIQYADMQWRSGSVIASSAYRATTLGLGLVLTVNRHCET